MKTLENVRACLMDMDGTIYNGSTLFPSTKPFLDFLLLRGIGRMFISNNSSYSTSEYVARLGRMRVVCAPDDFYTSIDYAIDYLHLNHPSFRKVYFLGVKSAVSMFEKALFELDDVSPDAVIIAFDRELTYEKLCRAAWHMSRGVPAFATHPDNFCPTDEPTFLVDCGALTACLERATGKKVKVLGKPDPGMIVRAAKRLSLSPGECLVIGDRVATDIACGRAAGAVTCHIAPIADAASGADITVPEIGRLIDLWSR